MNKILLKTQMGEYPIIIKDNLLFEIENYIEAGNNFVITNKAVYALYGKFLEVIKPKFIIIEDGEEFKNFATYEKIMNELLAHKIERSSKIIALGGGIVGDIAGFAASSILRGVDFIQIPTTLLAQVDSSVGGKTGFNTQYGKNLIGAFYQPKMVLIDPKTLSTLNERQIKTGLAEVVKYAYIEKSANPDNFCVEENFFKFLENNNPLENLEYIISKSCKIKADVVSADEKEKGLRAILNFGHTFAHAFEKVTNYTEITHGEGVSMGIKCAFKLALIKNLIDENYHTRAIKLLEKLNLKTLPPKNINNAAVMEAMKSDKKVSDTKINFILPQEPYCVKLHFDIDEPSIAKSLL